MEELNKNVKIMIVEDEDLLLKAIVKKMQTKGIETVSCITGQQALDYLENFSANSELPDAIWLDYYLKEMNGIEFMNKLRQNPAFSNVPVIVVSNSASKDKVNSMLALGVKKYFLKAESRLEDLIDSVVDLVSKDIDFIKQQDK